MKKRIFIIIAKSNLCLDFTFSVYNWINFPEWYWISVTRKNFQYFERLNFYNFRKRCFIRQVKYKVKMCLKKMNSEKLSLLKEKLWNSENQVDCYMIFFSRNYKLSTIFYRCWLSDAVCFLYIYRNLKTHQIS